MLQNIQALRALAAFMIVFHHCSNLLTGVEEPALFGWASAGVDIFFVISGYIMVATTRPTTTSLGFMRNRVERIVPLYWGITLLVFAISLAKPGLLGSTTADGSDLIKSLLFIPYVKGSGLVQPLFFIGWTLNLEMFFYVIFAACLVWRRSAPYIASAILVGLAALGTVLDGDVSRFLTQPMILEFGAGMLLAQHEPKLKPSLAWFLIALGFILLVTVKLTLPDLDRASARLLPSAMIVLGCLSLERSLIIASNRVVQELGNASFALYLVHPFITGLMVKLFLHSSTAGRISGFAASFVVSAAVAVTVHRLVEKPVSTWLKARRGLKPERRHSALAETAT